MMIIIKNQISEINQEVRLFRDRLTGPQKDGKTHANVPSKILLEIENQDKNQ